MTFAAIGLLIVAVVVFLVIDHSDDLRDAFAVSKKAIVPPLDFSQWTVVALVAATGIVVAVTFGLGLVNAMHRLTCNAHDVFGWLSWGHHP